MNSNSENAATKRKNSSKSDENLPKKYKYLSVAQKLEIISSHDRGISKAQIARDFCVSESSIRSIIKNRSSIEEMKGETSLDKDYKIRDLKVKEMEGLLLIWIEDNNARRIPMSKAIIQTKAKRIYMKLKPDNEDEECYSKKFKASDH